MKPYADTNFLTLLYLSGWRPSLADELVQRHHPVLPVTWLLQVELINAFEQAVFSGFGADSRRISPELAAACQQEFRDDLKAKRAMKMVNLPLGEATHLFEDIALRHTARHGFRAYDILHVASALTLGCDTFWSLDRRAKKLAKIEGLMVIAP